MAGRAVGVLLAVAALLAAATARAADDDDKTQPWQCFKSCARGCHHHHDNGASALADFLSGVTGECKNISCHNEACFKDLPAITYPQCAIATCLGHPHHSRKKTACLKDCCEKCFINNGPPAPGPPVPGPPAPGPPAPAPGPSPTPPSPPN
ncbi:hypothetical protein Zm00014a_022591 [Zea mays]|uniref:Uncharacterized protein n=1 Tax=Zea mays TaxID=4577 RepID=A0A3L6FLV6_MAIZE|nr:hypothetical protein Zm00014a_022591 [Zea mays]